MFILSHNFFIQKDWNFFSLMLVEFIGFMSIFYSKRGINLLDFVLNTYHKVNGMNVAFNFIKVATLILLDTFLDKIQRYLYIIHTFQY